MVDKLSFEPEVPLTQSLITFLFSGSCCFDEYRGKRNSFETYMKNANYFVWESLVTLK